MSTRDEAAAAALAAVSAAPFETPAELRGTVLDPAVLGRIVNEMFHGAPIEPAPGELGAAAASPIVSPPSIGPSTASVPSAVPTPGPSRVPVSVPLAPLGEMSASRATEGPTTALPWLAAPRTSPSMNSSAPSMPLASPLPSFGPVSQGMFAPPSAGSASLPSAASTSAMPLGLDRSGARVVAPPSAPNVAAPDRALESLYFLREPQPTTQVVVPDAGSPTLVPAVGNSSSMFDAASVRRDFPILQERVHGRPLIWLDNAATTQKPRAVIDRISEFYERENSNIHRAAHTLAARATDAYEGARDKVRRFIGAGSAKDIVFVRGTTEGINLIAQAWGRRNIGPGDEIVLTTLEHHSNIVPWQLLAAEKGAKIRVAPVDDTGQILLDEFEKLFNARTKIASFTHVSNALGTITPIAEMVAIAHRHGVRTVVDGAQSISHMPIDVRALDTDFFVFSGHKIFGPTGIGVVYGKPEVLEPMQPWQGGGNMIVDVTFERTVYAGSPMRFEAGTGNIADAVGLGAALDYLDAIGMENIARYEHDLLVYAQGCLATVPGLRPVGTAKEKASVIGFVLDGFESGEVGAALDRDGIAVRSGHHCAQPALRRFGLETSVRPSLALYNTKDDVDALTRSLIQLAATRGGRTR